MAKNHSISSRIETALFLGMSRIFCALGMKRARATGRLLGRFFYTFFPIRKGNVIRGLTRAFPDYEKERINRIARGVFENFGITLFEMFCYPLYNQNPESYCSIENPELIREIYSRNRGAIGMTAHFGSWEWACTSTFYSMRDVTMGALSKTQKNKPLSAWIDSQRKFHGLKIFPTGITVKEAYKALLDKNVILVAADQRGPKEGLHVKMFGIDTPFQVGSATLSSKLGVPVFFFLAIRQQDDNYCIIAEEIETSDIPKGSPDSIRLINQRYAEKMEYYLRLYPEQWLWLHEIWKNVTV